MLLSCSPESDDGFRAFHGAYVCITATAALSAREIPVACVHARVSMLETAGRKLAAAIDARKSAGVALRALSRRAVLVDRGIPSAREGET